MFFLSHLKRDAMQYLHKLNDWSIKHQPQWLVFVRVALGLCLLAKGISFIRNSTNSPGNFYKIFHPARSFMGCVIYSVGTFIWRLHDRDWFIYATCRSVAIANTYWRNYFCQHTQWNLCRSIRSSFFYYCFGVIDFLFD